MLARLVGAVGPRGAAAQRRAGVWEAQPSIPYADYVAVHGASAHDVFASSAQGSLVHFDGDVWSPVRVELRGGASVWASPACVYLGGEGSSEGGSSGAGLDNIRTRASALGGRFELKRTGNQTIAIITLPSTSYRPAQSA